MPQCGKNIDSKGRGVQANTVWNRLLAGNHRFAKDAPTRPRQDAQTRGRLVGGQHPSTAVLSCADSRVPPEIIFDEGLGDLFTIRTAGEVVDAAVLASLEFAIRTLGVSLIVVLGHQHCGAVEAAINVLDAQERHDSVTVSAGDSILTRTVGMSIRVARGSHLTTTDDYERVHVARTIERITDDSPIIREAAHSGRVQIVGARYLLSTGTVEVLPS